MRNLYTSDEIVLCTYAAIYNVDNLGGYFAICQLTGRRVSSVKMKVRNIAELMDENQVPRFSSVSGLTGTTTGQPARQTNWDIVRPLTLLNKGTLLERCQGILHKYKD